MGGLLSIQHNNHCQDANVKWSWWLEFQNKRRSGEVEPDMPGYIYSKWRNESEKRWEQNHGKSYEGYGSDA